MTDSRKVSPVSENADKVVELGILKVFFFFRKYFIYLVIIGGLSGIAGILYSFTLTRTYRAQTVLLPEYARMNERSGFFAMSMGMGGREGAENLFPELYSFVLSSRPFGEYLLKQKVVDQNGKNYDSLDAYFAKDSIANSGGMVKKIKQLFSSGPEKNADNIALDSRNMPVKVLTQAEDSKIRRAASLIMLSVNASNGLITIESETEDPVVSALIVNLGRGYLMDYVESYRTAKLSNNVQYLESQLGEAKLKQSKASYAYQSFKDRNQNLYLNTSRIEEERLFSEYKLYESLADQVAVQLEQTKLKLKQEKLVFKELEPVVVPTVKSGPNRILVGIIFAFLGCLLGTAYFLFVREKVHRLLVLK